MTSPKPPAVYLRELAQGDANTEFRRRVIELLKKDGVPLNKAGQGQILAAVSTIRYRMKRERTIRAEIRQIQKEMKTHRNATPKQDPSKLRASWITGRRGRGFPSR